MVEIDPTELLTTGEASRLLRVSVATVGRWVKNGTLLSVHRLPGKRGNYLISRSAVNAYLAEQDRKWADPTPPAPTVPDYVGVEF